MHAKVFSIQIFQYFRQISPRVCTLVLFIIMRVLIANRFLHSIAKKRGLIISGQSEECLARSCTQRSCCIMESTSSHLHGNLKEFTKLPILLKGILTAEDAREAVKHNIQGIIVSNHGGRQLDGVPAIYIL